MAESTHRDTVGAVRGFGQACPAITSENTGMSMALWNRQLGNLFFLVMPQCNTQCMNLFLQELSKQYPDDYIVLVADGAGWHKSKGLVLPANVEIISLSPYTPEMNPIEQIWAWIRLHGFRNEVFAALSLVEDRLCQTICTLSPLIVSSITYRDWILSTI